MSDSVSNVTEVEAVTEEETVTEVEAVSEAEDNSLVPIITEVGIQAIIAALREEKSVKITEIALGSGIDDAGYQSDSSAIALETEKQRVPVSNAETIGESQLHITANITGPEEYWVREVGFYLEDGTLLAIYASEGEAMAYKGRDVDLFIGFDLSLNALPADSVTVDTSTDINVAINSHSLDGINGGPRDALYVDHDGKVGIGTKEPGASLDVVGDIHTSDKLTIDTDVFVRGKIGVGTDLPEADLHVEGNIQTESLSVTGQTTISRDLAVGGSVNIRGGLEVEGETTYRSVEQHEGDVQLGNDAEDVVTITGKLESGHSSGKLQIDAGAEIAGDLAVAGGISGQSLALTGDLAVPGGISGQTMEIAGDLTVKGTVDAPRSKYNPMEQHMYPPDLLDDDSPKVYQDIHEARDDGAIVVLGSPEYDDRNDWGRDYIVYGGSNGETRGNGAEVTIPPGYDTLWVRVKGAENNGDVSWTVMDVYFTDGDQEDLGYWIGGGRWNNHYCPDGSLADSRKKIHEWLPIPVRRSGKIALIGHSETTADFWFSGLAFSKNPWHHAVHSARSYKLALNGGDAILWEVNTWEQDVLGSINKGITTTLKVPVVPSGQDKLLYLVNHNNDWNCVMHSSITVGGQAIERFCATYDNPFARHWNSKSYQRYIAARIPADFIPDDARHLDVVVDMTYQNDHLDFREIGTHDLETPVLEESS